MTNYICINGKKAELTEEQMKALGIKLPKASNSFKRVKENETYWFIHQTGVVDSYYETNDIVDNDCFNIGNYCTDKAILEQRALHETLNRLLWRYSMEHDGDKIDWTKISEKKYLICYHHPHNEYVVKFNWALSSFGDIFFNSREIAENAIEEVIKPFMKAHPDFKF